MYHSAHVGKIIRQRRKELHLTIAVTAEMADISDRCLEKIELGDCDPQWSTIIKLAKILNLNLGDFSSCVPDNILSTYS